MTRERHILTPTSRSPLSSRRQLNELGRLAHLIRPGGALGKWRGEGFNTTWRPHGPVQDGQGRLLELRLTAEKLGFTEIE